VAGEAEGAQLLAEVPDVDAVVERGARKLLHVDVEIERVNRALVATEGAVQLRVVLGGRSVHFSGSGDERRGCGWWQARDERAPGQENSKIFSNRLAAGISKRGVLFDCPRVL
jgi:hypothetical protein